MLPIASFERWRGRRRRCGPYGDEHRFDDRQRHDVGPRNLQLTVGCLEGEDAASERRGDAGNPVAILQPDFVGARRRRGEQRQNTKRQRSYHGVRRV